MALTLALTPTERRELWLSLAIILRIQQQRLFLVIWTNDNPVFLARIFSKISACDASTSASISISGRIIVLLASILCAMAS